MKTIHYPLLALLLGLTSAAVGREIYVNNTTGEDRFDGSSPQALDGPVGPLKTLALAAKIARAGDKIVLAKTDQPYRESITLWGSHNSGDASLPFYIEGNGAVLDGSSVIAASDWEPYRKAIFRFRPPKLGFQQLFLNDRPAVRVHAPKQGADLPELEPLQWCLRDGVIYFCVEPTKLPENYALSYAAMPVGITLLHVERVVIADLTIQGFQLDGINAANSAFDVRLAGLVLRGNGRSGLAVGGASEVALVAALVGNNSQAQLLTLPYSHTFVMNSNLLSNSAPAWVDQGGQTTIDGKSVSGGQEEIQTPK
jgi:hypothetical protein